MQEAVKDIGYSACKDIRNKETSQFYQLIYLDKTDLFVINKYGFFQILFCHLGERIYTQHPKNILHQGHYIFPSTY
ncbi:hypothetical protein EN5CB1_27880 [Tepidimicrobium xylanilyticum]|nr:hypothetical protein EN5CB1_27880 [Tepidimicrobium xylanilyticum]